MSEKNVSFHVAAGLTLQMESLFAEVVIGVGNDDVVEVKLVGDQRSIDDIEVLQDGSQKLSIRGKNINGVNIISTGTGSSVSNIRGTSVIVSGGVVVVNGKVISGTEVAKEMTKINVLIPKGTNLEISDVLDTRVSGVKGKLNAHVSGQSKLKGVDVIDAKIKCSGQSHCTLNSATGIARLKASGQSEIEASGEFGDIEAEVSGQSNVTIRGNCHDLDAEASGMSKVRVHGRVTGSVHERKTGMSTIQIH